jgi:hypothetical protein
MTLQGYGEATPDVAPRSAGSLVAAALGVVLVMASLFVMDFFFFIIDDPDLWRLDHPNAFDLSEIADAPSTVDVPATLDAYANVGRFLAVPAVLFSLSAVVRLRQVRQPGRWGTLPFFVAALCGVFGVWHLLAMTSYASFRYPGLDTTVDSGAFFGLAGYVLLGASPFVPFRREAGRQPLT